MPGVMDPPMTAMDQPDRFLTIDEVAGKLRCSTKTVRKLVQNGELQGMYIAGKLVFDPEAVKAYAKSRILTPHKRGFDYRRQDGHRVGGGIDTTRDDGTT